MKRVLFRIVALVVVVVIGVITITQVQRRAEPPAADQPSQATADASSPALAVTNGVKLPARGEDPPQEQSLTLAAENPRLGAVRLAAAEAPILPPTVNPQRVAPARQVSLKPEVPALPEATATDSASDEPGRLPIALSAASRPQPERNVRVDATAMPPQRLNEPPRPLQLAQGPGPEGFAAVSSNERRDVPNPLAALPLQASDATNRPGLLPPAGPALMPLRPGPAPELRDAGRSAPERNAPSPFDTDANAQPLRMAAASEPYRMPSAVGSFPRREASGGPQGTGVPGARALEGPQMPALTIRKSAPEGIQVGQPATFRVTVANSGQATAHGVEIRDSVPRGTQLISTRPSANQGVNGELVWNIGTIKPGDEVSVEMQVLPVAEGEIGSVATVCLLADASAKTLATKPELALKTSLPSSVIIGEKVNLSITISNPGSGTATGVVLKEMVPAGLSADLGGEMQYEIGTLKPGESREVQLPLAAAKPGPIVNVLHAVGNGNLKAEDTARMEVLAPQLDVALEGPKRRFLEREATYTMVVSNTGTAAARMVTLVAHLPDGMKFVSANNAGHYDPAERAVYWQIEELPAKDGNKAELVMLPVAAGEQNVRLQGKAEKGPPVEKEQRILVEGIAAVLFEVHNANNPIEVGGEALYEIRVANTGSKAASNVRLNVLIPPGMKAVAAEGPTQHQIEANRVQFEGMAQLAPKADTTYRVRVQGLQPGDLRVRVQLQTDEMQEPVTKEESTRVYRDE